MSIPNPMIAPTLFGRLACACNCAYGISTKNGTYTPPAIYDAGVGWKQPPVAVSAPKAGEKFGPRINACLIGLNGDGIIVAFRGTLPPAWTVASLEDWWQDIVDSAPIAAPPLPGKVHEGFWQALETLWADVLAAVHDLKAANPGARVFVTGHSKGGPLASIGAARLALASDIFADQLVTFASPHPGDGDFVEHYPGAIPVVRFENYLDIVPFLPPTDLFFSLIEKFLKETDFCKHFPSICNAAKKAAHWNYQPLGELYYVTDGHAVVHEADAYYRLLQILVVLLGYSDVEKMKQELGAGQSAQVTDSGLARIGAAHCIGCRSNNPANLCAGGYMTGADGDPVCAPG